MDATFSNNLLRMPLANVVGISKTGRTFSLAFSFIRSESAENFDCIFHSLDELVFHNVPRPRVVLSDQAKGFIKSLGMQWTKQNGTFHQLCEWHMVQNIKKRLVEGAYTKEQQDHVQHLLWKYIHCLTEEKMEDARRELYYELHLDDRQYMEDNWRSKDITKKKNASRRTSKRQDARNRPVRPVRWERAVLHLGARRKCRWILRPTAISQSFTFRTGFLSNSCPNATT